LENLIEVSLIKMKASSMADRSGKSSDGLANRGRLVPEMLMMVRIISPQRTKIVLLGVAIVLVIAAIAFGQIRLNAWNQPFYNALQRRDFHGFFFQLVIFSIIAGALLVLNVAQTWLNQATKVKLREGLARDLFDQWLRPRRAFRLTYAGKIGANPDQRIPRHLTELSTDLGIGLLQSSLAASGSISGARTRLQCLLD
jgi:putative ATP-binding cassette transporter